MQRLTIKPINFRGFMTTEKLKKYASDPNVFVMFNVYATVEKLYLQHKHLEKMPSYDECYRVKPLKWMYDQAIVNQRAFGINAICCNIDSGFFTIFRRVEVA